ncbi:prepilin-type N-terminal cleavage/methylation domain-containing protein [Streptococcus cuniculipharyngis]|uniref:Prepilin-type N-terminal cleavage/methylation domain-containing protein n=2 Tax=Streptococcus cuniculipharyngis TaxID=1562651 RepID=A0A5C5SAY5_9STRE|nr:prepilin-type N-terminal cleavage/methylation domain-containing protein [Streptococcus cuniculipharyngis]
MARKLFEYRKIKVKAFTLLECLVALLVIGTSLSLYQLLTKVMVGHLSQLTRNDQSDWLLFSQQLRHELSGTTLHKVENNKLYVTSGQQSLAFGKSRADDFRKTNANGQGYQPMLYHLKITEIDEKSGRVTIKLTFDRGLKRTFIYDFKH